MKFKITSLIAMSVLAIALAACGTTVGAPASPSQPATPSVEPSVEPEETPAQPSEPVAEEREVAGTLTVAEGMAFSGPGGTIAEALANGPSGDLPTLVRGVLFRDTDGKVYLATAVSDTAAPTFEGPMLEVLNTENTGFSWDMANAELLGLEEANGIVFNQDEVILGYLAIN